MLLKIIPFILAAALYTWTLRLPFFSDDVLHFRYATQAQTLDIWTKADITGIYYRPVVNFILHTALVYGGVPLSAPLWHLVMVWTHLLNIALVGALARALRLSLGRQTVTMLLFAAFPFSAQAVVWVLAWFHPLATTTILATAGCGLGFLNRKGAKRAKKRREAGWLIAAWVVGGLAPFVHENGVLATPLLGLCILGLYGVRGTLARWQRTALVIVPPLLCALLYFWLRRVLFPPVTTETPLGTYLVENLAAFAQGISFPLQFAAARLPFDGVTNAWLGFIAFIILCILMYFSAPLRFKFLSPLLTGAGWWALASLPAALVLTPIYVQLSERLLYIAAPGIALAYGALWANTGVWRAKPLQAARLLALIVVLALALGFISETNRLFAALGSGYREMSVLLRAAADVPTLLVNMPQQVDSTGYAMPLTRTHAFMLHDYLALRDFVWLNTGREFSQLGAIVYPDIIDPWEGYAPHFYASGGLSVAQSDRVIVFSLVDGQYTARLMGERALVSDEVVADFGGVVRLTDVAMSREDGLLRVGLRWQRMSDEPVPYVVFTHVLCNDAIIDQSDGAPIANLHDFAQWQAGESWLDYRYLDIGSTSADCLALRVGLYNRDDNRRAQVVVDDEMIGEWIVIPVP